MNKHCAGGGLHRSGTGSIPYCGTDSETGMRVAKLVPKDRTTGGSCNCERQIRVKAHPPLGGLSLSSSRQSQRLDRSDVK